MANTSYPDGYTDAELKRFAFCFICSERSNVNWEDASTMYDSNVKVASFKTVTNRALAKMKKPGDGADKSSPAANATDPAVKGAKRGRKRKASEEETEGDGTEVPEKKPKRGVGRPRKIPNKAKAQETTENDRDDDETQDEEEKDDKTAVKTEETAEGVEEGEDGSESDEV